MITRRNFVGFILGAPAIVRASSLMPLVIRKPITDICLPISDDFWRWTEVADDLVNERLKTLGISPEFILGDSTFGTVNKFYKTFGNHLKSFREDYVAAYGPYTEVQCAEDGLDWEQARLL